MKRSRSAHVRLKIVALLAALAALWAFAAVVTVRDGLNILFVNALDRNVARPTELLFDALQQERRLATVAVSGDRSVEAQLAASRTRTDQELVGWRSSVATASLGVVASRALKERIAEADRRLEALRELRTGMDEGSLGRTEVLASYTAIIEAGYHMYGALTQIDDQEIARQVTNLLALARAREVLSQQDALLAGVLTEGSFNEPELTAVTQLIGAQRYIYASTSPELPDEDYRRYEELVTGSALTELRRVENLIIDEARSGTPPPVSAQEWQEVSGPAFAAIRDWELATADGILERATPAAVGVIVRLILAGGLGLIAVLAAVVISITTARGLVRQLERLRDAARDLAGDRLPKVVDRLSAGEQVDVATEAPPLRFGDDEIGQVGQAFNVVQETAVRAAVSQAELRRGVRDVFLSLARRTQNLVHKQLSVLDGMERRETDADEMEEIYRVDHLATRMRRNAENLIVLSGASPGRTWRRPVAMIDVVRGAIAEVEDYTRVGLLPVEAGMLDGRAVGDVIHLLAELIENAASYSPPYAKVNVSGQRVAHGFVVEVEDRGLGMTEAELAAANAKLGHPPDFSLADASRLGHYVVAKLAQRHGIRVHLRTSPYGGIVAIVLIPAAILAQPGDDTGAMPAGPAGPAGPAASDLDLDGARGVPAAVGDPPAGDGSGPPDPPPVFAVVRQRGATPIPPATGHEPRHRGTAWPPAGGLPADAAPLDAAPFGAAPVDAAPLDAAPREAGPADPGQPSPAQSAPASPENPRTPSGLPWRVRQANLPKQVDAGNGATAEPAGDEPAPRDPEQVRRMMHSYQHGTLRGRTAADPGQPPEPGGNHHDASGPRAQRPTDRPEG